MHTRSNMANALALMTAAGGTDEPALPLVLFVVFASSLLLAEAADRLRLPGIVGGMAAGVLIGPSALPGAL